MKGPGKHLLLMLLGGGTDGYAQIAVFAGRFGSENHNAELCRLIGTGILRRGNERADTMDADQI